MRFLHISDLHLGRRLKEYNLLEDQEYILKKILAVADEEKPEAVVVAGDVYDKSVPSAEAVQLFDGFLCDLVKRGLRVFVISENHDSPERLAFGSRLIDARGVYLAPVYDGKVEPVTLNDGYGPVDFFMLPFLKPANVRRFFPD
ncbi:MAG: exonuclease subunit SbcD, partial [Oscillospiraceae bacterium]|nr:exonuclease subunit SbcD [Oscillospiraceae bacterium]